MSPAEVLIILAGCLGVVGLILGTIFLCDNHYVPWYKVTSVNYQEERYEKVHLTMENSHLGHTARGEKNTYWEAPPPSTGKPVQAETQGQGAQEGGAQGREAEGRNSAGLQDASDQQVCAQEDQQGSVLMRTTPDETDVRSGVDLIELFQACEISTKLTEIVDDAGSSELGVTIPLDQFDKAKALIGQCKVS